MNELHNCTTIPEGFWMLIGIGIMVLLCCAGRALIIHEKAKIPGKEAGSDETDKG